MKIAILGDSISEGIGRKKINYSKYINIKNKNNIIINKSLTGTTIRYGIDIIKELVEQKIDYIVIFYGNVDALPRPKKDKLLYKLLPKRYKKLGMLDPRALYSSNKRKCFFQKIDSFTRYNIKKILIKMYGYEQFLDIEEFEKLYEQSVQICINNGIKLILISTVPMSEKYFPHANYEYCRYNKVIENIANKYDLEYVNIYEKFKEYDAKLIYLHDLYHPNELGYQIIANSINDSLKNMEKKNETKQSEN